MLTKRLTVSNVAINAFLMVCSIVCILPVILVLAISLSDEGSIIKNGFSFIPQATTLYAYRYIISPSSPLPHAYLITIGATACGAFLHLFISGMLAYTISRPEVRYRKIVSFMVMFCLLFSGGLLPTYTLFTRYLGLGNKFAVLFVPYLVSSVNVLMMRNFFQAIPDSIIESARIDGSGEFNTFLRLVVPLSTPVLATVGLFVSVFLWNDWFTPSMYITNVKLYTLQFLLQSIMNNIQYLASNSMTAKLAAQMPGETARMAICMLSIGPIILLYPFLQRFFVKGLTLGAVKQ